MARKKDSSSYKPILKRWKIINRKFIDLNINLDNKIDNTNINTSKEKKNFSNNEVILIILAVALVSFLLGLNFNSNKKNNNSEELNNFIKDYNKIIDNYYDDVDEKEILKKALETIISELDDPYSQVVDDSLANTLSTKLQGEYKGLGVEIANTKDNRILIVSVIDESPAFEAGLKPGDYILKLNSEDVSSLSTTDFVNMVKEKGNDSLTISILRNNQEKEFTIKQSLITLKSVSSSIFEKNNKKIGYIYINVFASNTSKQFEKELKNLQDKKIDSLIIDVRSNTGGHLDAVSNMLSTMLDKKHVIYQIQSKSETKKYYSTGNKDFSKPIAILTNEYSASASELLTAGLKEELGAISVGMKTYGKGTVQEVVNSDNTDLEYKLTTTKWLTPKGNWINKKGIKPDYEIQLNDEYIKNPTDDNDNQLQKAIDILIKK